MSIRCVRFEWFGLPQFRWSLLTEFLKKKPHAAREILAVNGTSKVREPSTLVKAPQKTVIARMAANRIEVGIFLEMIQL
ncbi:MAG: hypothetical protein QGF59_15630, partial [Pirellulaceae bacterium]|nr:hypothetical protein [Pirellulaceae bacterium]